MSPLRSNPEIPEMMANLIEFERFKCQFSMAGITEMAALSQNTSARGNQPLRFSK